MPWRIFIAVLSALAAAPAFAGSPRFASFTFENDFFAGYDRHYTNGVQLAALVDLDEAPPWLPQGGEFNAAACDASPCAPDAALPRSPRRLFLPASA